MGAVACLAAFTSCSHPVSADWPSPTGADARACRALVDSLPGSVGDHEQREVKPDDAYGAAYGDPPLLLLCGVPKPKLPLDASCQRVNGVDWYVSQAQIADPQADVVATTVGRTPYVELRIPAEDRPPDAELVDVARTVKQHTKLLRPCL